MDLVSRDIINGLPDPLISHILSFLPTKEAASSSVLSKRWRFLFASVTNLDFKSNGDDDVASTSFMDFVERVLALQGSAPINRFSLDCSDYPDVDRVTSWILNVLKRGVSDFDLSLSEYPLPPEIFVSKTLVKLKLGPGNDLTLGEDVEDVFLPMLKTLDIDSVVFEEEGVGFAKLLSGCPVLGELALMNIGWENWKSCSVSVTTLKRLTFSCDDDDSDFDENPNSVSIDTPNLEYLEYSDTIADKYPKVNFDSLVEAHIGLRMTGDQIAVADATFSEDGYFSEGDHVEKEMVGNATDFLMGICNVRILYLSAKALEVLAFCCEATPVFNNLNQLMVESNSETGWDSLPGLLNNCPNLETLIFEGLVHKCNDRCGNVCCCKRPKHPSCLSSSPVKVLKIVVCENDEETMELEQVKHFLKKMPCLEQLIVYFKTSYDPSVFELSKKLQKIRKMASPKCKIHVISQNLSLASTLPSSLTTRWSSAPPEEEYAPPEEEYAPSKEEYDPL
uniref:F-box/LRR-repeat protein n=1 Tax=Noccaea caerulescens TaxID=107243 RepID=A0A1J3IKV5_NOCCA